MKIIKVGAMHAFVICGYGIPKDIAQDVNYTTYLHLIFNKIYEEAAGRKVVIIPCGGPTKCDPPYEGTEAQVIGDYFRSLMEREEVHQKTTNWNIHLENESLSTLENLLFAKKILKNHDDVEVIEIFCEKTREERVRVFAEKIFNEKVHVHAIDFDVSKNRYLDPDVLKKKEMLAVQEGLWTLEEPERIARHHEFFEKKFAFLRLRQSEGLSHVDAVKEWLENQEKI